MSDFIRIRKNAVDFFSQKYPDLPQEFFDDFEGALDAYSQAYTESAFVERSKELNCVHSISKIVRNREYSLDEMLEAVIEEILKSMQFPEIACARISCCDKKIQTKNYTDSPMRIDAEIQVGHFKGGELTVAYTEIPPIRQSSFFLREEEALIYTLAEIIGTALENRRYEKALVESQSKYSRFFKNSSVGIIRFDAEGEVLEINDAYAAIFGYESVEEFFLNRFNLKKIYRQPEEFEQFLKSLQSKKRVKSHLFESTKKNGTTIWLDADAVMLADNETIYFEAVVKDISLRKKAQDELKESENKYRSLLNAANDAIFIADADTGIIVECNAKAESLIKKDRNEINGSHFKELHPKEKAEEYAKIFERLLDRESSVVAEVLVENINGNHIPVEISTSTLTVNNKLLLIGIFRDISERKLKEKELKAANEELAVLNEHLREANEELQTSYEHLNISEQKFRAIFENINDAVGLHKVENGQPGNFLEINRRACEMFGYTYQEFLKMHPMEILPEHAQTAFADNFKKLAENKLIKIEAENISKSGNIIPVEITALLFQMGGEDFLTVVTKDISERKKAQAALKESEERYRLLSELAIEGIILHKNGIAIDTNTSFQKMFGYERNEIIGQNITELLTDEEGKKQIQNNIRKHTAAPYEIVGIRKNGTKFIAEIEARNINVGEDILRVAAVRDITERKNAERKFKQIFRYSHVGIALADAKGNIIQVNDEFERMLGYSKEELQVMHFFDFTHPEDFEKENELALDLIEGKIDHYAIEKRYLSKQKNILWVDLTVSVLRNIAGDIEMTIGMVMDIGERKKREEVMKQNHRQLKELIATKDKFFSIISHDLKNPLSQLAGFSELILKSIERGNYNKVYDFGKVMLESAHHGIKLLENIMQWSGAQTGRINYNPKNIVLYDVVSGAIQSVESAAITKQIEIQNLVSDDYIVYADTDMLQTIIRNLLSNAVKFTHRGGEIQIYTIDQEHTIQIHVADNGVGMKKEILDKLFRIEENISRKGTEKEKGTGLGLLICKEFAERHGGELRAESEYGKGSTFILSLPKDKL